MHYTARPTKPSGVNGNILIIDNSTALATVNWIPPQNQNHTTIDYYDITLIGDNRTSSVRVVASLQTLSYKYNVLTEGNYTTASVEAVDLCGQRSGTSLVKLTFNNGTSWNCANPIPEEYNILVIIAGVSLTVSTVIILLLIIIYVCIRRTGRMYAKTIVTATSVQ